MNGFLDTNNKHDRPGVVKRAPDWVYLAVITSLWTTGQVLSSSRSQSSSGNWGTIVGVSSGLCLPCITPARFQLRAFLLSLNSQVPSYLRALARAVSNF